MVAELRKHLAPLRHEQIVTDWYDLELMPGQDWDRAIISQLESSEHNDRPVHGRGCLMNVRCGDRLNICNLDRPAHFTQTRIDGDRCGSAAVRITTRRGDLCLAGEFNLGSPKIWRFSKVEQGANLAAGRLKRANSEECCSTRRSTGLG